MAAGRQTVAHTGTAPVPVRLRKKRETVSGLPLRLSVPANDQSLLITSAWIRALAAAASRPPALVSSSMQGSAATAGLGFSE